MFLGFNFNEYFGVEADYNEFGEFDVDELPGISVRIDDGVKLMVLGRYPFSERFSIFSKVGVSWWDAEGGFLGDDISFGASLIYGAGAEYGGNVGIRFEWDRFEDVTGSDIDFFSSCLVLRLFSQAINLGLIRPSGIISCFNSWLLNPLMEF